MITWDILVITIPHRHRQLCGLLASLGGQMQPGVAVCVYRDNLQAQIGAKRQRLLQAADAGYVSFIDDDDRVAPDFIPRVRGALEAGPDYVGFPVAVREWHGAAVRMVMEMSGPRHHDLNAFWPPPGQVLGASPEEAADLVAKGWAVPAAPGDLPYVTVEHSLRHGGWSEDGGLIVRDISHLNPLRRELALLGTFEGQWAEDRQWAAQVRASGQARTEQWIDDPMYFRDFNPEDCSTTPRAPARRMPRLPAYPWLRVVSDGHVGRTDLLDPAPGRDAARAAG